MTNRISLILLLLTAFLVSQCSRKENPEPANGPQEIFETVWSDFDKTYPYFIHKKIDWDSVYEIYSGLIHDSTSSSELFSAIGEMTLVLKDIHVNFTSSSNTYNYSKKENYPHNSPENASNYLDQVFLNNSKFIFGDIDNTDYSYFRIKSFTGSESEFITANSVLDTVENRSGLIIDIRDNGGGNELNGRSIAGRFTESNKHYKNVRVRNGKAWDDFSSWNKSYLQPLNPMVFDKKIILLTNRRVYSSAELFVLMMKTYPQLIIVGDTSGGASANPALRNLSNGWKYRVSTWQASSINYELIEDKGIAPDYYVLMSQESIDEGKDQILEKAIELLDIGKSIPSN